VIGNRLGLDVLLGVKILRPTIGSWKIVEKGRTWDDFALGSASAMRRIRATRRGHRCWIVATRSEVDGFAAAVAWGARAAETTYAHTTFALYIGDPRQQGTFNTSSLLGSGLTIPCRLPKAYQEAIARIAA
jgi:hypothetical protein